LANALTESEVKIVPEEGHGTRQARQNRMKNRKRDMTTEETFVSDDENVFQTREAYVARQELPDKKSPEMENKSLIMNSG
jgi:hypothetical protein